jgi:hypothetical protein
VSRISSLLRDFVEQAGATKRLSFGDLRRLQRVILPFRLTSREEAELLISLNRAVERADADWSEYLIVTMRDFVVWGLPPFGSIDREKAEWLVAVLSAEGSSKISRQIAREVAREAREVDDLLRVYATRSPRRRIDDGASQHLGL